MSKAELQQHLEQLHTDLTELQGGDVDQLDERTRALIEQIHEDLDGLESHEAPHAAGLLVQILGQVPDRGGYLGVDRMGGLVGRVAQRNQVQRQAAVVGEDGVAAPEVGHGGVAGKIKVDGGSSRAPGAAGRSGRFDVGSGVVFFEGVLYRVCPGAGRQIGAHAVEGGVAERIGEVFGACPEEIRVFVGARGARRPEALVVPLPGNIRPPAAPGDAAEALVAGGVGQVFLLQVGSVHGCASLLD